MKMMKTARGVLVALATLGTAIAFGAVGASAQEPKVLTMALRRGRRDSTTSILASC